MQNNPETNYKSIHTSPSLTKAYQQVWACLSEGAGPGRSPFSFLQLATINQHNQPAVRNIVLRTASEVTAEITFNTDIRSAKIAELAQNPDVSLVGYDPEQQVQVRLQGTAGIIASGPVKKQAWEASREHSLVAFRNPLVPGSFIKSPEAGHPETSNIATSNRTDGYENFCVLAVSITGIDWLDLAVDGHQRAVFRYESSHWWGSWVVP